MQIMFLFLYRYLNILKARSEQQQTIFEMLFFYFADNSHLILTLVMLDGLTPVLLNKLISHAYF